MPWKTLGNARDGTQHLVDRLLRRRTDYQQLLQGHSRALTTLVSLPRLLETIAAQIEEVFHPAGLAIALPDNGEGYHITLSRGKLAAQAMWKENTYIKLDHPIPLQLASQHRALDLSQHMPGAPEIQEPVWLELQRSGAHVFVPMHMRGTLVGWVVLGPRLSGKTYSRRDLDFLCTFVDQSCVALENARLYGEMQRRATELAMLSMVSSAISSSLDLERVLESIVESIVKVVGCDKSAIFELSEDSGELDLRIGKGFSPSFRQSSRHMTVGEDNRTLAVTQRQPFIVTDILAEPRLADLVELAREENWRAVVDVPMAGREGIMGVLSVYFADVHEPTPGELEILTTFSNQAAIAIENARLYAAVTRERDRVRQLYEQTDAALARRVEELTAIEEISRQLTGTLDLNQVLNLLLERAMQAADADRGIIALYLTEQNALKLVTQKGYSAGIERFSPELWPDDLGIMGRAARTMTPSLVPDVSQDADYTMGTSTTQSQLSVPIVHEEQAIGVITLESDRLAAFGDEHLRFTKLLADHAAIGIYNAQLFEQVMEGRDRLQAILNSTNDAVIVQDTEGRVILVNPRLNELFAPLAEEWIKSVDMRDASQVLASREVKSMGLDASSLAEMLDQAQESPDQIRSFAFFFHNAQGQRYVEGTGSPVLSASGEVIGQLTVLRDMTHQKELEQFRADLTSMVIHNLQGPLAAMISSLEMLREDAQGDQAMASELLRIALSSGHKLYERIESLLWIRRLEDKQLPLDLHTLPLLRVVQPVLDEYTPMAAMSGVQLEGSIAPDLPPVLVDEEVIGRVFSNLLDNALKFTPPGGQIRLQAARYAGQEPAGLICSIADTGAGIPKEVQETIFDRFRRGKESGRRKGMGLGLHYCKVAVESHGGRIWVESQHGEGSTFFFTLPQA